MDLDRDWNEMWGNLIDLLPKVVLFLVILIVGWIIAKALEKATNAILERVGFDRAIERGGVGRTLERSKYDASDFIAKLVYFTVILMTLVMAFGVFGDNAISDMLSTVIAWLPRLLVGVILLVLAAFLANMVRDLLAAALGGYSIGRFVASAVYFFILGLGVIAALAQIGVATAVTMPLLIFILATIGGVIIVGVGGGMIVPMRARWEDWLSRMEMEGSARRTGIDPTSTTVLPPDDGPMTI